MASGEHKVLLTGATGFVGRHALPALAHQGFEVRAATRHPERAGVAPEGATWCRVDVSERASLDDAMRGCRSAIYLVHAMGEGRGYEAREEREAQIFADCASACGLDRIVYLGGVAPRGRPSHHLASRLRTGAILRRGRVPVFELRASMIVGHGSQSWKIVHDLAARLPVMILPRWLSTHSQPVAIDDVVEALVLALSLPLERAGIYDIPGPETLSAKEILARIAHQLGGHPWMWSVPVLTPRLSSYWLKLVTGADYYIARQLVEGLASELMPTETELWPLAGGYVRTSFDDAVRRALDEESRAPH